MYGQMLVTNTTPKHS